MIRLQCVLLALFLTVAYAKYTVDYNSCKAETECFLLKKCAIATGPANEFDKWNGKDKLADPSCMLILQKRFYTDDKILFFIQVNKSIESKKIRLFHGRERILTCQHNVTTDKISVKSDKPLILEPYEDLSYFDGNSALCAFTADKISALAKLDDNSISTIRFDKETISAFTQDLRIFSSLPNKVRCDPDTIQNPAEKFGYRILTVKYKARLSLDCSNYKTDLGIPYDYHLYVGQGEENHAIRTSLECAKIDSDYLYKYNNGTDDIFLTESFFAYCALEINKTCGEPSFCAKDCPTYKRGDNANPASFTCTDGKWIIAENYYDGIQPICKPNSDNKPLFYMQFSDQPEKELTEGQCYDKYDCMTMSKLDINECAEGNTECAEIVIGDQLSCKNPDDYDLLIYSGSSTRNDTPTFDCDPKTGLFTSPTNPSVLIPINSRVVCRKKPEQKAEPMSQGSMLGIGAAAVVGSALFAAGVAICIYCMACRKRKEIVERIGDTIESKHDRWMRMSKDERQMEAFNVFVRDDLLGALKMLDVILECESEEPLVWEAIESWMRKFQAAALSLDRQLEKAFNRYCYLQARKIIDKHGWTCPLRITRERWDGYIRVCAVRLLALARRDDVDAQKMVLEGFKALRFNAVDQYPHCGLLWAVLTQQRVGYLPLHRKLIDVLQSECPEKDVPREEQFSWFGSVKDQVYFAIGASDVCFTLHMSSKLHQMQDISLKRSFLEGTVYCTSGNTTDMANNLLRYTKDGIIGATKDLEPLGKKEDGEKARKTQRRRTQHDPSMVPDIQRLIPQLDKMIAMMIFQRRFRAAKASELDELKTLDMENWYNELFGLREEYENKKTGKPPRILTEAEIIAKKNKPKTEPDRGNTPSYHQLKSDYRAFMEQIELEHKPIQTWLSKQIAEEEKMKMEKSKSRKDSNNNPLSNSDPIQVKEGTAADNFIERFVDSFHKERNDESRISSCVLPENDQNKFRAMLQRIFSDETILGHQVLFTAEEVIEVLEKAVPIFASEPVFIEDVPAGISVFDLARIFEANAKDGKPGYEIGKYLFLGDYCDRGTTILEVILALYILKILYPDRFWILRGNHEFMSQNWHVGTMEEIEFIYGKFAADYIYYKLNESFAFLSICAVVGGEIFCAHGGISASPMTRHELRLIRKPITDSSFDVLVNDMLWSDPTKGADGFFYNEMRSCSIYYGEDFLEKTLEELECTSIIRGHQVMNFGYAKPFQCMLIVFSATAQNQKEKTLNDAAFVRIAEDLKYEVVVLQADYERDAAEVEDVPKVGKQKPKNDEITKRETRDKPDGGKGEQGAAKVNIGTGEVAENSEVE